MIITWTTATQIAPVPIKEEHSSIMLVNVSKQPFLKVASSPYLQLSGRVPFEDSSHVSCPWIPQHCNYNCTVRIKYVQLKVEIFIYNTRRIVYIHLLACSPNRTALPCHGNMTRQHLAFLLRCIHQYRRALHILQLRRRFPKLGCTKAALRTKIWLC